MNECIAVGLQQLADLEEIFIEMPDADMLHHADRNHAVELSCQLAVVQLAKLDKIGNAGGFGIAARRP